MKKKKAKGCFTVEIRVADNLEKGTVDLKLDFTPNVSQESRSPALSVAAVMVEAAVEFLKKQKGGAA